MSDEKAFDLDEVYKLLKIEEMTRQLPQLSNIHGAVMARLNEIDEVEREREDEGA